MLLARWPTRFVRSFVRFERRTEDTRPVIADNRPRSVGPQTKMKTEEHDDRTARKYTFWFSSCFTIVGYTSIYVSMRSSTNINSSPTVVVITALWIFYAFVRSLTLAYSNLFLLHFFNEFSIWHFFWYTFFPQTLPNYVNLARYCQIYFQSVQNNANTCNIQEYIKCQRVKHAKKRKKKRKAEYRSI